ncbi:MAG TPA: VOC family protein [Terriglobales bacterium]|nr:VOC family protein [Terriglobales bacterium]
MPDPLDALRLPIVPVDPRPEFADALLRRIEGRAEPAVRRTAGVRYFVDDLDAAVDFYRRHLDFAVDLRPSPTFAILSRGELRLMLSVPGGPGRSHVLPDGTVPEPGGWNRISLPVADLALAVEALRAGGATLRTGIVIGVGVRLALLQDPSGNPIELFERYQP